MKNKLIKPFSVLISAILFISIMPFISLNAEDASYYELPSNTCITYIPLGSIGHEYDVEYLVLLINDIAYNFHLVATSITTSLLSLFICKFKLDDPDGI